MKVSVARRIAFEVLLRVESEEAFAADLLHARLSEPDSNGKAIKHADAALATELTLGVLRRQRLLDFLIEWQSRKAALAPDAAVRIALRLGLYQLRFLTRVPARAAVHEAVELVKLARKRSAAPFVNAVLRRVPSNSIEKLIPASLPPAERLGIMHSHPTWLVERWMKQFGEQRAIALLEANNGAVATTCAVLAPERREEILNELSSRGISFAPGRWLRDAIVVRGGSVAETQAFRRGWITIQDEASQMVALLLETKPHDSVLDLCAAPGGKTGHLARAAGRDAIVVASDRSVSRLRAMRASLARTGFALVHVVALDGELPLPFTRTFDRILVDAPCSGTGTLARNPEIRYRLQRADFADLHTRQVRLLANALQHLVPEGRLVYSTCSLEPEENEQVVNEVLSGQPSFQTVCLQVALLPHLRADRGAFVANQNAHRVAQATHTKKRNSHAPLFDEQGAFRTFPPEHGMDGFFAVAIERRKT